MVNVGKWQIFKETSSEHFGWDSGKFPDLIKKKHPINASFLPLGSLCPPNPKELQTLYPLVLPSQLWLQLGSKSLSHRSKLQLRIWSKSKPSGPAPIPPSVGERGWVVFVFSLGIFVGTIFFCPVDGVLEWKKTGQVLEWPKITRTKWFGKLFWVAISWWSLILDSWFLSSANGISWNSSRIVNYISSTT